MTQFSEGVAVLLNGMHFTWDEADADSYIAVYDEDGDFLVRVPADIGVVSLQVVFRHGTNMFNRGVIAGRDRFRNAIREALGFSP